MLFLTPTKGLGSWRKLLGENIQAQSTSLESLQTPGRIEQTCISRVEDPNPRNANMWDPLPLVIFWFSHTTGIVGDHFPSYPLDPWKQKSGILLVHKQVFTIEFKDVKIATNKSSLLNLKAQKIPLKMLNWCIDETTWVVWYCFSEIYFF